jgi:hypothetical protein
MFCFLIRHLPELRCILLELTNKLEGRTVARPLPEGTKAKPFNLTVSKARIVPVPKIVRTKKIITFILFVYYRYQKSIDFDHHRNRPMNNHEIRLNWKKFATKIIVKVYINSIKCDQPPIILCKLRNPLKL